MRCNALLFSWCNGCMTLQPSVLTALCGSLLGLGHADVPDGPIARVLQLRAHPVFGPFHEGILTWFSACINLAS